MLPQNISKEVIPIDLRGIPSLPLVLENWKLGETDEVFRQELVDFSPNSPGPVFQFLRGNPQGHDIVSIHFVDRDARANPTADVVLPGSHLPERGEVGD